MTAFGKANYEAYREFNYGKSAVTGEPIPEWDDLPVHIKSGWSAGADAVALVLAECPVNDDAPGSGPQPAKVIVVTEVPVGDGKPVQRRYQATQWDDSDYSRLRLIRSGQPVGTYAGGAWLSVREEGAIPNDGPAGKRKLAIALAALDEISGWDDADSASRARQALEDITDVDL